MTTSDQSAEPFLPEDSRDYRYDVDDDVVDPGPDTRKFERHRVTAVLVAHDGQRWLPRTLAALAALTRSPERLFAVDTGSTDRTPALLAAALGSAAVLTQPSDVGFGAAVRYAVEARQGAPGLPTVTSAHEPDLEHVEWLWLLHDDCAPEPEALRCLLAAVDDSPSIGIAGPKVRGWSDPSLLLEVGLTAGGGGRRETGLERREIDQGQHDDRRDVLAVGSAGLLIRRDVWDQLGGFDPRIEMFREDLDLGWRANLAGHRVCVVPQAVVHHAEATAHGRRPMLAAGGRPHRADRRSTLHVLLVNSPWYALPWHWARLFVGSLLRALGLLLGKAPGEALDEFAAMAVLVNPASIARARRARQPLRRVSPGDIRPLLAPPLSGIRHTLEGLTGLLAGRIDLSSSAGSSPESGPIEDDSESLTAGPSRVRALVTRRGFLLFVGLTAVSLLAFRGLVVDPGQLVGGMLLPAPDGASSLWSAYSTGWHDVGLGSAQAAPPYLVPLAVLSSLLLGKTWLAVTLILVLGVPCAGVSAYLALGRLRVAPMARLVAAIGYAVLPGLTGAVASGRIGTVVVAVLLPPTGWLIAGGVGLTDRPGSLRRTWVGGLLLSVIVAFVPIIWVLAAASGVLGLALLRPRALAGWGRLLAALAVPALVLLPWTFRLLRQHDTLLLEAGAPGPGLADPALPAWHLAAANPGGPGVPAAWLTLGLLFAGLASLLSSRRQRVILAAWVVTLTGLVSGVLLAHLTVTPPAVGGAVGVWPGVSSILVGGGLLTAVAVGGEDLRSRLRAYHFGWRQPVTLLLAALAALAPFALGVSWLATGVDGPMHRSDAAPVPAYVSAAGFTSNKPRALLIRLDGTELARYTVIQGAGRVLGDAEVEPPADRTSGLESALAGLLAGKADAGAVGTVRSYGIGFLVLLDPTVAEQQTLDAVGALQRVSSVDGTTVWRVTPAASRVRLVTPGFADRPIPADPGQRTTTVDQALTKATVGSVVLAESADSGWRATLSGQPLASGTTDGWAQSFVVPPIAGQLVVAYNGQRGRWLALQAGLTALLVILALPGRRRVDDDAESDGSDELAVGSK